MEDSDPYVVLVHTFKRLKWKKNDLTDPSFLTSITIIKISFRVEVPTRAGWVKEEHEKTSKMTHNANPRGGPYLLFFQYRHLYTYVQTHRDGSHYYYHTSAHKRLLRAQGSPEGCQVLVAESVSVH